MSSATMSCSSSISNMRLGVPSTSSRCPRPTPIAHGRGRLQLAQATKDPDNLFKGIPVAKGIIEKRLASKEMAKQNKSYATAMQFAKNEIEREEITRREARIPPTEPRELIEFMLNTIAPDMEFEVARCRPMLDDAFFKELDKALGEARFQLPEQGEEEGQQERIAELEMLRDYLGAAVKAVDAAVAATMSAKDRMKKLLGSKDKKAAILEMAEANEIDAPLMDLLKSNVLAAREAGQKEAAEFMEKVLQALAKYAVTEAPTNTATVMPAAPALKPRMGGASTSPGGIIVPGGSSSASRPPQGGGSGLIIPGGR